MKKRLGTVLLLALFVISSMMPTSAATAEIWNEARASHYQNLISMVFDLMGFRDDWMREGKAKDTNTVIEPMHLVLVEEPEAHLHIIAYTYDCEAVKATAMKNNWFEDDEIRLLE